MTERDPIIVQTERRTMSVELTDSERGERSQRVHVEIAARIEEEARQATLEAEAKAKREDAKSAAERVAQRQIQINRLSEAARTGRETRQVDVVFSYDPTCGEVVGRREDTGEEVERRKPSAEDWDAIKAEQAKTAQQTLPLTTPGVVFSMVPLTPEQATTAAAATIAENDVPGHAPATVTLPYPMHPARRTAEPEPMAEVDAAIICGKAAELGHSDRKAGVSRSGTLAILKPILGSKPASAAMGRLTNEQAGAIEDAYDAARADGDAGEPEGE